MDVLSSGSDIWEAIELSESYMICCMFKEAVSLSSSVLQQLQCTSINDGRQTSEMSDMLESAGMVLVQSLKESGRTKEIFAELEVVFGSIDAIPGQVFVTGAAVQLSESLTTSLRPTLEQFLGAWKFVDGHVIFSGSINEKPSPERGSRRLSLDLERYMDVIDIYVIQLLAVALKKVDLAISWTKNTELPDEKRQDLLSRLQALNILYSGQRIPKKPSDGISDTKFTSTKEFLDADKTRSCVGESRSKASIIKAIQPFLWRFSLANIDLAFTCSLLRFGKLAAWGSLAIFICYVFQRKRMVLKRLAVKLVYSTRRALIDAWRLAFTVQVNPLAAVQPLTPVPQGSR